VKHLPATSAALLKNAGAYDYTLDFNRMAWSRRVLKILLEIVALAAADLPVFFGSRSTPPKGRISPVWELWAPGDVAIVVTGIVIGSVARAYRVLRAPRSLRFGGRYSVDPQADAETSVRTYEAMAVVLGEATRLESAAHVPPQTSGAEAALHVRYQFGRECASLCQCARAIGHDDPYDGTGSTVLH
jgi:hypothetical protein